jgi:hypothetical protein
MTINAPIGNGATNVRNRTNPYHNLLWTRSLSSHHAFGRRTSPIGSAPGLAPGWRGRKARPFPIPHFLRNFRCMSDCFFPILQVRCR